MPKQRGSKHLTNRLSAQKVRTAPPGFYCDGQGLNLRVDPSGARRWVQRLVIRGKPRTLGLGGYPLVSLKEAREKALANRKLARAGGDPLAEKRRAQGIPTFAEAATKVIELHRSSWSSTRSAAQWQASLRDYVLPQIGTRQVDQITTADVMEVLLPIWSDKPETARRVRQRISTIMKWVITQGYRLDNPAGEAIGAALPKQNGIKTHHRALPHPEVAKAIAAIQDSDAYPATKLCFEFIVLTACRSGEVRHATWNEINLDTATWTVPPERMKAKREHRVPLPGRAIEILLEAQLLSNAKGSSNGEERTNTPGLVFPSPTGRPLSDNTISKLLRDLKIPAVPHGFRSSFRDWAAECTNTPREVMEAALAHIIKDKAEAAYARSDLLDRRRSLMNQWADYLEKQHRETVDVLHHA
ncbi:MAG: tyrosine-type recombinase/integrase [Truepera sp.]|nr:tyrosine-type recombinase/integrase [Truepera sp.]